MTPDQFILEYWKFYDAYMQRKEHLIEVATTLYSAFVLSLLLQQGVRWANHPLALAGIGWIVGLLVFWFVGWQFTYWSTAARICNASQAVMGKWLEPNATKNLAAVDEESLRGIKVPEDLAQEIKKRRESWKQMGCWEKIRRSPFEVIVFALLVVWMLTLLVRVFVVWMPYHAASSC